MSATIPASKGGFDEQIKKKTVMTFFLLFYSVRSANKNHGITPHEDKFR
jgi:hypothetical protein